jgi:signal transduction histidine kinase
MFAVGDPYVVVLALMGVVQLSLAAYARRGGRKPGSRWFVALGTFGALWVMSDAVGMALVGPGFPRLYVGNFNSAASTGAAIAWIGFVVAYTGRGNWLTPARIAALAAPPAVLSATLLLAPTSPLVVEAYGFETVAGLSLVWIETGPLMLAVEVYLFALLVPLYLLIVRSMFEEGAPYTGQLAWVLGGSLAVLVGAAVDILDLVAQPLDVLGPSLGATVLTCSFAVALYRHRLLRLVPAVSHLGVSDAVADLDDGVLVVDTTGAVVRANPAARAVLDAPDGGVLGRDVRELVPELDALSAGATATVRRRGRTYRLTGSAITARASAPVGWTFLLRDVTERERREQRLAVLGRVLRHNLRNDVGAIEAHASVLERAVTDEDLSESAATIQSLALGMAELGDKARLAQETLEADTDPERVRLAPLVEGLVERARADYPSARVSTSVPDVSVVTLREPLSVALENVLENAIEHAGDDPTVEVTARPVSEDRSRTGNRDASGEASTGPGRARPDRRDQAVADGGADDAEPADEVTGGSEAARGDEPGTGDGGEPPGGIEAVEIAVSDDGPGIPSEQVAVLEAGTETQQSHGDGIGLWLVYWATTAIRGSVTFDATEAGSRVRLEVPALDDPVEGRSGSGPEADASTRE